MFESPWWKPGEALMEKKKREREEECESYWAVVVVAVSGIG